MTIVVNLIMRAIIMFMLFGISRNVGQFFAISINIGNCPCPSYRQHCGIQAGMQYD